jgi:hypothetical protein
MQTMKRSFLFFILALLAMAANAQKDDYDEEGKGGFKKENVFLGGSISLGFGSGSFGIGANPEVGYSLAQWLDAGLVFNINYFSQKYSSDYSNNYDVQVSSFNYGGGAFLRVFPLPFLFAQFQLEQNWIDYDTKYLAVNQSSKQTYTATSLLGSIGYSQRIIGQSSFYTTIGIDLLNNVNSPYRDGYGGAIPIIRGGFDVYLRPSRKPKPSGHVL